MILPEGLQHVPSLIKKILLCLNIPPALPAIMLSRWYQPPLQALTLLHLQKSVTSSPIKVPLSNIPAPFSSHHALTCRPVFTQESLCLECSWKPSPKKTRWLKGRRWSLSALWPKALGTPHSLGTERTRGRVWGRKASAPREQSWRSLLSGRAMPGATTAQLTTATASSRARQ